MAEIAHFQLQYQYHFHVIRALVEIATRISDEELIENPGYGRGSIYDLLFHLLRADQSWRIALQTGAQPLPLDAADYPDLEMLQAAFDCEELEWCSYLETLKDEQLDETIILKTMRAKEMSFVRWRILQHILFHGMQHQSELAQALTLKGQNPGDFDFLFYQGE